jgi:hypothetical protein
MEATWASRIVPRKLPNVDWACREVVAEASKMRAGTRPAMGRVIVIRNIRNLLEVKNYGCNLLASLRTVSVFLT